MIEFIRQYLKGVIDSTNETLSAGSGIPRGHWSYQKGQHDLASITLDMLPVEDEPKSAPYFPEFISFKDFDDGRTTDET